MKVSGQLHLLVHPHEDKNLVPTRADLNDLEKRLSPYSYIQLAPIYEWVEIYLHSLIRLHGMYRNNCKVTLFQHFNVWRTDMAWIITVLNNVFLGICKILGPKQREIFVVKIKAVCICVQNVLHLFTTLSWATGDPEWILTHDVILILLSLHCFENFFQS
jgi:hypothetical protein